LVLSEILALGIASIVGDEVAGLTSPEDKIKLGGLARTLATTSDQMSDVAECEKCSKKNVRAVRSLARN